MTRENLCHYYLCQLKNAIHYLHSIKIIHRDLKPKNILVHVRPDPHNDKVVKLADFGFARFFENDASKVPTKNIKDTLISTICGSPIYMAPELLINHTYNIKADLWSFGIIMYEMLYGSNPYNFFQPKDHTDIAKLMANQNIIFKNIFSPQCINLLKALLQIDPNKRIDWDDFFSHEWFSNEENDDSSDSDVSDESYDPYTVSVSGSFIPLTPESSDIKYGYIDNFDNQSVNNHYLKKGKSMITDSDESSKSGDKYVIIDGPLPSIGRGTGIPIKTPITARKSPTKLKKYKEKESFTGSFIKILSDSVPFLFGLSKSY